MLNALSRLIRIAILEPMPSLYARWMRNWETRLTQVDNNRVVRPLEWGIEWAREWPCRNGVRPGQVPENPEKFLLDYNRRIVAASDEQSKGIEQINHAISQMDMVTQQNAALVEEAMTLLRPRCRHAHIEMRWQPPAEPITIEGDPGQLEHLFLNILGNAIDARAGKIGLVASDAGKRRRT